MVLSILTGTRLRERRMALGIKQGELADAAGISPSYLNLIEHNRRKVGPDLLVRLAARLEVEVAALAEGAGGLLVDELRAVAADHVGAGAEMDRIEEFAGRFPGWAGLLGAQARRGAGLMRAVEALNDRMSHDPHLSAALHDILSAVSSVRSTVGILVETPDIEPDWQARFMANLHEDAERLALRAAALVAFLDGSEAGAEGVLSTPQEELEAWLEARDWQLAALETDGGRRVLESEVAALASAAGRQLARRFLERAEAEARALPGPEFGRALAELGPDPVRLAAQFGTSVLAVFRRIALLPGYEAGLVTCDASGTLTFSKPLPGFSVPRFGAACPLWPLFSALSRPSTPVDVVVETAGAGGAAVSHAGLGGNPVSGRVWRPRTA